jgi:hypothetical protein
MLHKLGDHITNCLTRAEDADRRGLEISDPEAKAETARMAKAWRHLARSYEFIESLERFLLDGHAAKNGLPATLPQCPKCGHDMQMRKTQAADDDWSGRLDLNQRPTDPQSVALTGLRYAPQCRCD